MAAPQPLRVLCLAGFRQSERGFREKTGALRKALRGRAELVCLSGPHPVVDPVGAGQESGEYFLQTELTSNVLKTGVVHCCVGQCNNTIPVDTVLTMKKLPITYSNRKENKGGYLCHSCAEQRIGPLAFLTATPEQVHSMPPTVENIVLPRHEALLFLVF